MNNTFAYPPSVRDAIYIASRKVSDLPQAVMTDSVFLFSDTAEVALRLSAPLPLASANSLDGLLIRLLARHSPARFSVLATIERDPRSERRFFLFAGCDSADGTIVCASAPVDQVTGSASDEITYLGIEEMPADLRLGIKALHSRLPAERLTAAQQALQDVTGSTMESMFSLPDSWISPRDAQKVADATIRYH